MDGHPIQDFGFTAGGSNWMDLAVFGHGTGGG